VLVQEIVRAPGRVTLVLMLGELSIPEQGYIILSWGLQHARDRNGRDSPQQDTSQIIDQPLYGCVACVV
jgi:hypothetical protein